MKQDLQDFKIEINLSNIKKKSAMAFKNLVRKKANEFEYNQLMKTKQTHSKMSSLNYTKLEIQNYLKLGKLNTAEAQTLFRYRVRMANYGENFRGKANAVLCPLCNTHLDNQKMCFENCPVLKKHILITGNYEQIFDEFVASETVKILMKIDKVREESSNILSRNEANSTRKHIGLMGASDNVNYQNC